MNALSLFDLRALHPSANPMPVDSRDEGARWTDITTLPASTIEDMSLVELEIASHLGGESGRCAWLHSRDYMRLRLTALYFPHLCVRDPVSVYQQGLRVSLLNGFVMLSRRDASESCHIQTLLDYMDIAASEADCTRLGKRARGTR